MDHRIVLERLDAERGRLAFGGVELEILPRVTRARGAGGAWHTIVYSSFAPDDAEQIIDEQVEHYRRLGAAFEWKVYSHDDPPDLRDRLARRGFDVGPAEAVVVYDLSHRPAWLAATDHTVVRVDRPALVDVYRDTAERIFGKDYSLTANELVAALASGSTHHRGYIAYAGDRPVSVGRLYTHPDSAFGGLYGGATLPAYRGRGFYRAVVAARARDAVAAGSRYLLVDALPTSLPILQRLGFGKVSETWPCEWRPA